MPPHPDLFEKYFLDPEEKNPQTRERIVLGTKWAWAALTVYAGWERINRGAYK